MIDNLKPLVTIIIPVYNGSNFLSYAIDSALSQDYENIEIIVVNDGSSEKETESVALSYGDKIKYYYKENGGVSSALNYGISVMSGEYFSWLSHDDEYAVDKISKQVEWIINNDNEKVIPFCNIKFIDENGKDLGERKKNEKFLINDGNLSPLEMLLIMLKKGPVNGCTPLIKKEVFLECGEFNQKHRYIQDLEMWVNFCLNGYSWKFLDYAGVLSRVHENQVTGNRKDLLYSDCIEWAEEISVKLLEIDDKGVYLFAFAKFLAKYGIKKAVNICSEVAKGKVKGWRVKAIKLKFILLYAKIRPLLKKIYYKLTKKH